MKFYHSTILLVMTSVAQLGCAVELADVPDEISNLLQPRMYLCHKDSDCANQKVDTQSSVVNSVKDAVNKFRFNNKLTCHRQQYCVAQGSDLVLDPFPDNLVAVRALYTSQLVEVTYDPPSNKTLGTQNSYCGTIRKTFEFRDPDGPTFMVFEDDDEKARAEKMGILAFKGTTTRFEWTNVNLRESYAGCLMFEKSPSINASKTETACGLVHSGFQNAFLKKLVPQVQKAVTKYSQLIIIGHSLDGALAVLASFWIAKHMPQLKIEGVHLFGAPRVGNQKFTNEYRKILPMDKVNRFVTVQNHLWSTRDPVTLVPPKESFQHVKDDVIGLKCVKQNNPKGHCTLRELHGFKQYSQSIRAALGKRSSCIKW